VCKLSRIESCYHKHNTGRVVQGDILKDIMFIEWDIVNSDPNDISFIENKLSYAVILSQDCDLDHDFKNRNDRNAEKQDAYLQSILVCPAYLMAIFKDGNHLKRHRDASEGLIDDLQGFNPQMEPKGGDNWKKILKNRDTRYHFLQEDQQFGVPDLILDFKHYYTLPVNYLYKIYQNYYESHYVASLGALFRECLCQRFSFYLSRIGLPEIRRDA
jgi:hypothetical protein